MIEIELFKEVGNIIIKRDIRKDGSSEFRLNGKVTTQKEIQQKVRALNIHTDNLCQFLPQERVYAFAQLNSSELLKETERAVGDADMLQSHLKLVEMKKSEKDFELQFTEQQSHLENMKRRNQDLEREVRRYEEKQKFLKMVDELNAKKLWFKFEKQKRFAIDCKTRFLKAEEAYNTAEAEYEPLIKRKKKIRR